MEVKTPRAESLHRPRGDPQESAHPGAAILIDRLAGDAAGVRREQPGDRARDIVRLPHSPERHGAHCLAIRVRTRASATRAAIPSSPSQAMSVWTQPGQIALTCTFSGQELGSEGAHEAEEPRLGRAVPGVFGDGDPREDRRHDPPGAAAPVRARDGSAPRGNSSTCR